ncbi:metal-dependent hydrolase [Clostridium sp. CS001]|uniref:metal-dependent hydrolase n=1 Tax=Clostridium sp. CS001 TaxID=2880648 RepID=UPI001CF5468E|nr:metal-dependent hydrolase [Clostridium sp. CS001]MCB2290505.1 metal-dependent hydrolase [Clostridium sp. CS001]
MTGKTHAGIGSVIYVAICNQLPGKFNYIGMILVFFASILPDVDHPKSMINKYILPFKNKTTKVTIYICLGIIILWFDFLYTKELALKSLAVCFIIIGLSTHRNGLLHSLTGMMLLMLMLGYTCTKYLLPPLVYPFIIGYGSHLVGDMFTKMGVPLFYPFSNRKFKFPCTYKVGSKAGKLIEEIIMIFGVVYIVYALPKML